MAEHRMGRLWHYLTVFCMPVALVGVLLVWNNAWYTRQNTQALHAATLSQVAEAIDAVAAQSDTLAQRAGDSEPLLAALTPAEADTAFVAQWVTLQQEMCPLPVTVAVYRRGTQEIILKDGPVRYSEFEQACGGLPAALVGLYTQLNQAQQMRSVTLRRAPSDPYSIAYVYPLNNARAQTVGSLCVLVPASTLSEIFSRFFDASWATLTVLNAAHQPLLMPQAGAERLKELRGLRGAGVTRLADGQLTLRHVSAATGQVYYVSMPENRFYGQADGGGPLDLLIIALVVAGGAAAVGLFRRHQHRLQAAHERNNTLVDELDEQAEIIRNLVLRKLVDGSVKDARAIRYNLYCANLALEEPDFCIAILAFATAQAAERAEPLCRRQCEAESGEGASFLCFARAEDAQVVVLLNTRRQDGRQALREAACRLRALFPVQPPEVGISRVRHDVLKLNHAFVEAAVALQEKTGEADKHIYLFDLPAVRLGSAQFLSVEKTLVRECLRNNNSQLLEGTVGRLFNKLVCQAANEHLLRCACFDVINLCIALAEEFGFPLAEDAISAMCACQTAEALREQVSAALIRLCGQVSVQASEQLTASKYNLMGFVQEHFRDPELSLTMLSDQLHLTQSYISKLFKDETGQTFISYVKQLRFSYVKKQLAETQLPVKDIVTDAGYVDVANFSRSFKAVEGVTPGEYRRAMQARRCEELPIPVEQ